MHKHRSQRAFRFATATLTILLGACAGSPVAPSGAAGAPGEPTAPAQMPVDMPANKPMTPMSGSLGGDARNATGNDASKVAAEAIDLMPLTNFVDPLSFAAAQGADFAGMYTRLLIRSKLGDGKDAANTATYEKRDWFKRLLSGKAYTLTLSTILKVDGLEQTVPLVSLSHESTSKSETWSRSVLTSGSNYPLFLVSQSGRSKDPSLEFLLQGELSYNVRAASRGVRAIAALASAGGTTSTVVTRLTEQSTKNQAEKLEQALSALLGSSVSERRSADVDLRLWRAEERGPTGVSITMLVPAKDSGWNGTTSNGGTWSIGFDFPRPSVFVDAYVCGKIDATAQTAGAAAPAKPLTASLANCFENKAAAAAHVKKHKNAAEILSFSLTGASEGDVTIQAFLARQSWYTHVVERMAVAATRNDAAGDFCRSAKIAITSINLSGFDADLVAWAAMQGLPLRWPSDLASIPACADVLKAVAVATSA